jgi:hypothetical protein
MHVPEVQRPGPGAPSTTTYPRSLSQPIVPPTPSHTTYLSSLQTDRASHSPTAGVYPSHSGPITPQPQITNPAMVPGGYSAPFIYPTDQQTQAPRTHGGIDYSQWVAAYHQGQQQPFSSSYGSAQGWTPQQAPTFYPSSVQPDLRENTMNEALPRIGGYGSRNGAQGHLHGNGSYQQQQHQQQYYTHSQSNMDPSPAILSSPEHNMSTTFINHNSNSFDPNHNTLITPPRAAQISPDPSTSPIDPAHQPLPSNGVKFTSRGAKSTRKRPRRQVQEASGDESDDAPNGGGRGGMDMFSQRLSVFPPL